jgi:asparagine synthase (glutamine-hydrolysing)
MLRFLPVIKNTFKQLNAEFACVYADQYGVIAARDPMGVRPLYVGFTTNREIVGFSSEAKGFWDIPECCHVEHFPPGKYYYSKKFLSFEALTLPLFKDIPVTNTPFYKHVRMVRKALVNAVQDRVMMSERSVAFFLSGGLDSSIVAAIGAELLKDTTHTSIHTFSIGVRGSRSPDLEAARIMADHIGSYHHEVFFEPEEAVQQVERVIRAIESYDCTTVRASVPMFLLAEHIAQNTDHKVILSGEGADELFGGYLYFHNAPSNETFHNETIRLLKNIHQFDGLRADRCTAAHGLEVRVPFLDPVLVEYVTTEIHPDYKNPNKNNGIEKCILREAFAYMLPNEILHRQKNGMSDAVGYAWVDFLRDHAKKRNHDNRVYTVNPPMTDEERWYRDLFHKHYPIDKDVVSHESIWRPKWTANVTDPSARQLSNVFKE